ncbi:ATP-grasp domain-containing protein [Lichenicoccus sp.]|uniref:ATP-grasp domain-containing protein n=1 Tax=Lichenicoccus sp. TaxID=2781899 RepID=UPI003D0E3560
MSDQLAAEWQDARSRLERATADPSLRRQANRLLWDLCQFLRDRDAALTHLHAAIAEDPLFTRPHLADVPPSRSVLVLAAPGDYQTNLPLDRLFDESTLLHTLWIADPDAVLRDPHAAIPRDLPAVDVVFIAIAEDARSGAMLRAADALAASLGKPTMNCGARIARLSRAGTAHLLENLADGVVPSHHLVPHGEPSPIALPIIIRPLGSHAGEKLHCVRSDAELDAYYVEHRRVRVFTIAPFIDYRSADGFWRKYRVIFVDGIAYPLHLAIHHDWAVWYYNAGMQACPRKQAEEQRFLDNLTAAMPARAVRALTEIARRVGLDYFGLDCSVLADGRLLVFEVETGMIVQNGSGTASTRIRQATERLIERRRAR